MKSAKCWEKRKLTVLGFFNVRRCTSLNRVAQITMVEEAGQGGNGKNANRFEVSLSFSLYVYQGDSPEGNHT